VTFNNFAISSLSRSGSTFLARVMDKSEKYRVYHERDEHVVQVGDRVTVQKRFARKDYGEVSSRLRFVLPTLNVKKKGVILRNPFDLLVSVCNRREDMNEYIYTFGEHFKTLDKLVGCADVVIRFEHMTTSATYLDDMLRRFGISDVPITDELVHTRQNVSKQYHYQCFRELPLRWRRVFLNQCEWFILKHGYTLAAPQTY